MLDDQAWSIIGHLEGEARNYIINKAGSERDAPEKVFELLFSRFGAQAFLTRAQQEKEDWMQYLDALEGLRSQGFPQEPITTERYEILQRFIEGVRNPVLRRDFAIVYASESFRADPPTVESLRFTTRQLQRNRPKATQRPYDPRLAMRSRPRPFLPLQPQGVIPPPAPPSNAPAAPAAVAPARAPIGACFNCGQNRHFFRKCPNRDQARKPGGVEPHSDEAVKATVEDYAECVAEKCSGVEFCVNCVMVDYVASHCMENPVV